MDWQYDPNISSTEYIAIARKRLAHKKHRFEPYRGCHVYGYPMENWRQETVINHLLTADIGSDITIREPRKPRLFLDARINARGNLDVQWWGGSQGIRWEDDFDLCVALHPLGLNYGHELPDRVLWVHEFRALVERVVLGANPVAKALLFAVKAQMRELAEALSTRLEIVGRSDLEFTYSKKRITRVSIVNIGDAARIEAGAAEQSQIDEARLRAGVDLFHRSLANRK